MLKRAFITLCLASMTACGGAGRNYDMSYAPTMAESAPTGTPASQEAYDHITDNAFLSALRDPLSTFAIDVDTASYANMRRFLNRGTLPPADAVRIEEMLNYFSYAYPEPTGEDPFAVSAEISRAPWNPAHRLVHIGLQGRKIAKADLPPSNLVFLLDVSGSMSSPHKLPLLKQAFSMMVENLDARDRVAIVVYAGAAGLVLPSTSADNNDAILSALNTLSAGGSTAGAAGIELAYQEAQKHFIKGGNNRVILATDGDFNVGISSNGGLERFIAEKRETGVYLTVLGFGSGNYKDSTMERLSNAGNGNAAYIDSVREAEKVLVTEMGGTLHTLAKDVKIQVEFNPAKVKGYRLIGYENRMLRAQDFNDDRKDAGELGAGHTVTALYEIIPAGSAEEVPGVDALKYQATAKSFGEGGELLTVKLRYKQPDGDTSKLLALPLMDSELPLSRTSDAFRWSSAVAEMGMILRMSKHRGKANYAALLQRAEGALGKDEHGHRQEFLNLARKAQAL